MNIFIFILQVALYFITMSNMESKKPAAAKLEDLNVPEVSEVKSIAVGYGTYKQRSPNLIWYGNLATQEIKEEVGSWIAKKDITVGYRYYLSQWYALAHGEIYIKELYLDDKLIWENTGGETGNFKGHYDTQAGLFMDSKESFNATFDFYSGNQNQPTNQHLVNLGIDAPQYPGICHVVFRRNERWVGGNIGNNPGALIGNSLNVRPLSFVCTRFPDLPDLDDRFKDINGDCNPAWILLDILTATKYGLGLDKQYIDIDSFDAAAFTLFNEGFGLSLIYEDKFRCDEFTREVLRHISGELIEDAETGKLKLKLIRGDYDVEDLTHFDESIITEVQSFSRTTKNELYNEVKITYTNASNNFKQGTSIFQNLGLDFTDRATKQRSVTMDFPWCTKAENAAIIANREAVPMTSVLSSIRFKAYRYNGLEVGDVIKVSWGKYNISEVVFRVQEINYGNLNNNYMIVSAIQDSFSINFNSYSNSGDNKFEDITVDPKDLIVKVLDCPYFMSNEGNNLLYRPDINDGSTNYYEVYSKEEGESSFKLTSDQNQFFEVMQSDGQILIGDKSIEILPSDLPLTNASVEQNQEGKNLLLLIDENTGEHEFISFAKVRTDGTINNNIIELTNCRRGCLDTLPKEWSNNTALYIVDPTISTNSDFTEGEVIKMKATSTTVSGSYPLALATETTYTMPNEQRNKKPIVGGFFKGNGQDVIINDTVIINDNLIDVEIEWLFKNLINQRQVLGYYEGDDSNISNVDYVINIYDNTDNTLIKTITTQTNSYVFDDETTINPLGERYPSLRIEIHSELNGYTSRDNIIYYVQRP